MRPDPAALHPAGIATRVLAAAIDVLVLVILFLSVRLGLLAVRYFVVVPAPFGGRVLRGIHWAAQIALVPAYHVFFWTLAGRTPGKWLLGIRVVTADGRPIGFARAVIRFVAYTVSIVPLMAGVAAIAFDPRRRAWHDHLAQTRVVYDRAPPASRVRVRIAPADGPMRAARPPRLDDVASPADVRALPGDTGTARL